MENLISGAVLLLDRVAGLERFSSSLNGFEPLVSEVVIDFDRVEALVLLIASRSVIDFDSSVGFVALISGSVFDLDRLAGLELFVVELLS